MGALFCFGHRLENPCSSAEKLIINLALSFDF